MNPVELPDEQVPKLAQLCAFELEEAPTCLAVSNDGSCVALGSILDEIIVCRSDLKILQTLAGHDGGTNSLCFTSTGVLVSSGEDGTVKFWEPKAGTLIQTVACDGVDADRTPSGHTVCHLDVGSNGTFVACASGRTVHTFDTSERREEGFTHQAYPPVDRGVIEDIRCVSENLILAAHNGGITWFRSTPSLPSTELPYGAAVMCLDATPDWTWIVGGTHDAQLHIWNFTQDDGKEAEKLLEKAGMPEAAAAAAAAAASSIGRAKGEASGSSKTEGGQDTESEEGKGVSIVELSCGGYMSKVLHCRFDPSHTRVASSGGPHCTVWDFTGKGPAGSVPVITLGHGKPVECMSWQRVTPGQQQMALLASGGRDGRVMVYDVNDYLDQMPKLCLPVAGSIPKGPVAQVCWGRGRILYSAHMTGEVCCWQTPMPAPPAAPTATRVPATTAKKAGKKKK